MKMKRLVVADDDESILSLLWDTLRLRGYEIVPARDGQEAWHLIQREVPDVALLDVKMPGLSGIEICRRLRSDPTTRHIGVIFLTASEESKYAAFRWGADAYMVKPFSPRDLRRQVEAVEALARHRPRE